jgi:hypothetical protein
VNRSPFVIGIDLGTTNTCLSYIDIAAQTDERLEEVQVGEFAIPQVTAAGAVEPRSSLPSVVYMAGGPELPPDSLHLPWRAETRYCVGQFAREQGTRVPTRLIQSSKSWLSHSGVDRSKQILPWQSPDEVPKRSPGEVATIILEHLRDAWNHTMARGDDARDLTRQAVTLCVPASFDAEARNLTVEAAKKAGLRDFHLLEEPQAALYSWVESCGPKWRRRVKLGDLVLVVDVGGGTTDFSLIAVTEEEGELQLRRVAVGEHILLGGDNMDLALAFTLKQQIETERNITLDTFQLIALTAECRVAKERMLSDLSLPSAPITILGRGSGVVGGTIRTELKRENVDSYLLAGFFPECKYEDRPRRARRAGFAEAGLPYATDGAITRHLARFLGLHQDMVAEVVEPSEPGKPVMPTAILFNGGVFRSEMLRQRILSVVSAWCESFGVPVPRVLEGTSVDLAVSRGAAYFGLAKQGRGVRIRGGSARSYYVGFEAPMPAVPGVEPPVKLLCVVPYGMEEGSTCDISGVPIDLCMWKGEPVDFRFFSSTSRRNDKPGSIRDLGGDQYEEHSALETTIGEADDSGQGEAVEVDLQSHLTEIGVLELGVVERQSRERHKLEFNVRHAEDE